eukprot:SAG25_NODE_10618_length_327_cov_1.127193_1_plen_92_part_10
MTDVCVVFPELQHFGVLVREPMFQVKGKPNEVMMPCAACKSNACVTLESNTLLHGDIKMYKDVSGTKCVIGARYRCYNIACPAVTAAIEARK